MLLHMDKIQEQLLSEMILQTGTFKILHFSLDIIQKLSSSYLYIVLRIE